MTFKHLTLALSVLICTLSHAQDIPTRYGTLKIGAENVLLYKGRPLKPEVQGNSSLSVLGTFQQESNDIVLVQDNGGSACPAMLQFISVSATGAQATKPFGTCTDLIEVKQILDVITVTMPGFLGPFEPRSAQQRAAKQKHVYVLKAGLLTENGKPLR